MVPLKNCKSLYQNMGGGGGGGAHTSESLVRELLETPLRRRLGARRQVSAVLQVRAASRAEDVSAARRPRPWRSDAENRLAEGTGENVAGRGSELDQRGHTGMRVGWGRVAVLRHTQGSAGQPRKDTW